MSSGQLCDPDHPCVTVMFFDSGSYDLTESKRKAISQAFKDWQTWGQGNITVCGHTDASGSAQDNMRLSAQRADAVKAQLVADGVKEGQVNVKPCGHTTPLLPTYGSAPNSFNRRVEIWIEQK